MTLSNVAGEVNDSHHPHDASFNALFSLTTSSYYNNVKHAKMAQIRNETKVAT